jgi:glycosyltransferase involved in cell wall biosynthesis
MKMQPLVSIILPVYNEPQQYLKSSIESILDQTYENFELIIMDDGSEPETANWLKSASKRDQRIRLHRQNNSGLTVSLNRLIRESRGQYIARQDADDKSEIDRIEQEVKYLKKHPQIAMVGTACSIIDQNGKVLLRDKIVTDPCKLRNKIRTSNQFVHGSVMFRGDIFRKDSNYYFEEYHFAQDYDLFLRLSEKYSLGNIGTPLYFYRINPKSISISNARKQLMDAMIARKVAKIRRKEKDFKWSEAVYQQMAAMVEKSFGRRQFECKISSAMGRNHFLLGEMAAARQMYLRALLLSANPKAIWWLLNTVIPKRQNPLHSKAAA